MQRMLASAAVEDVSAFVTFLKIVSTLMFYKGYQIVVNVKTAVHKVGQAIKNLYNLYMSPFIPDT